MTLASGAESARPAPAAAASACGTGHTIAALYVNPDDGTYQVRYRLPGPPYGQQYEPPTGHHPAGERVITLSADADDARLLDPTWQETARAVRPFLPGLPAAGIEAYARALLTEARRHAFDYRLRGCCAPACPGTTTTGRCSPPPWRHSATATCPPPPARPQEAPGKSTKSTCSSASRPSCPASKTTPAPSPPFAPHCASSKRHRTMGSAVRPDQEPPRGRDNAPGGL